MKKKDIFKYPIRIYIEDTDAGGIVYYANYLKFFERARTEYLRHKGFTTRQLREEYNQQFVVRDITLQYKAPAFLDDTLEIHSKILASSGSSLVFLQEVYREETLLATARVTCVCVNERLKPTRLPDVFKEIAAIRKVV